MFGNNNYQYVHTCLIQTSNSTAKIQLKIPIMENNDLQRNNLVVNIYHNSLSNINPQTSKT